MLRLNCSRYKCLVVSSPKQARFLPETIRPDEAVHQGWLAKSLGLLMVVGILFAYTEPAYCLQQDANTAVVIVIQQREDGSEKASVGLVVSELAQKTIVQVNPGWFSNEITRRRNDKSTWSVMINPGTSGSQIVPAKFLGNHRAGGPKPGGGAKPVGSTQRAVDCILLSTASDQMPSPCVNVDFYSDKAELTAEDQVSLFSLKADQKDGEWVVTPTEKTATVTTATIGTRKVNKLKSDDFVDGFVFDNGQIFGFAKDFSRKSPQNKEPEPMIRVTPLRLVSDFGIPKLSSQYLVQKSVEDNSATISIVVNCDDPLDAIEKLSAEVFISAASETEAAAEQFKSDKAVPTSDAVQTVEFRKVAYAERSEYGPFSGKKRRRSSSLDRPTDTRWVADIDVPNAADGKPRLLIFNKKVEVSDPKLTSKVNESERFQAASSLAFTPKVASPSKSGDDSESVDESSSTDKDTGTEQDADDDSETP